MSSSKESVTTSGGKGGGFQSLGLEKVILNALNRMSYKVPTPVQRKTLPIALAGMDVVCMARTGSGKTCAFLVPLVQKLKCHLVAPGGGALRGLILSPTRELATQTFRFAKDIAKFTDLRVISIVGGDAIEGQFDALAGNPDIVVATPGRLMHLLQEISSFNLKFIQYLAFDEADRLFEMGFAEQLNQIIRECPAERQTLLFSATMPKMIVQFSRAGLRDPQLIRLDTDIKMSDELRFGFFSVRSNEKLPALLYLVRHIIPPDQLTIIFAATRHHSELIYSLFKHIGVSATLVYGTMDQDLRNANLKSFRNGEIKYMIVTDLAARGLDVPLLNNVINFHFPPTSKLFVHRCGRAARQGRIGFALSLVEPEELAYMADVHIMLGKDVDTNNAPRSGSSSSSSSSSSSVIGSSSSSSSVMSYVRGDDEGPVVAGESYTLATMRPSMVHTGLLPADALAEDADFIKSALSGDDALQDMWRVAENGMKQYRRTRTEASKQGIKIAKALVKAGAIRHVHPLIAGSDNRRCNSLSAEKQDFVRMLQTFRPAQTVFETGIGTGTASANAGQGHGGDLRSKTKMTSQVQMMKALRDANSMHLERNRVRGDAKRKREEEDEVEEEEGDEEENGEEGSGEDDDKDDDDDNDDDDNDDDDDEGEDEDNGSLFDAPSIAPPQQPPPRVSMAERRKLKKQGLSSQEVQARVAELKRRGVEEGSDDASFFGSSSDVAVSHSGAGGMSSGIDGFKDRRFYMSYGTEDERANFSEEAMQPKAGLRDGETQAAMRLEHAMLDIAPDEAMELNKKKRVMRWDAKKRKFVKQSLSEIAASGGRDGKRVRSESGVVASSRKKPVGDMYDRWKKKSHREVGSISAAGDDSPRPNFKSNRHVKDELRSPAELAKLQKKKTNVKMKNMTKEKRTSLEGKARKFKKEAQQKMMLSQNRSRKSRIIVKM